MYRRAIHLSRSSALTALLAIGFLTPGNSQTPPNQSGQPQPAPGQTVEETSAGILTLRSTARTVIVDVVVTKGSSLNGKRNDAVTGLHKEDFEIYEQGQPQTITFFEEHPEAQASVVKPEPRTPNVFSNTQDLGPVDAVNVILLDAINTPIEDQARIHAQIVKYLKTMPPGKPVALFSLAVGGLTYLHGFTTNPAELLAVLDGRHPRGGPQFSPLLHAGSEDAASQQANNLMIAAQADRTAAGLPGDPGLQGGIDMMQQFQAQQQAFEGQERSDATLDALRQIARYLTGVPGRKNVVWFSSAFPLSVFQDPSIKIDPTAASEQHEEEVQQTTQLLSAAQVALYPVGAEGVESTGEGQASDPKGTYVSLNEAANNASAPSTGLYAPTPLMTGATDSQIGNRQTAINTRNQSHATMDLVAEQTGGAAFYNTNAVDTALAHVLNNGVYYYRIAYTPTDRGEHQGYRNIEVKIPHGHYHLAYRRSYLVESPKKEAAKAKVIDPLAPMMKPGMPDFSQIVFKTAMQRSAPLAEMKLAGQNSNLKQPLQRYTADFAISTRTVEFEVTPDGVRHGNIEIGLVAFDNAGHAVNWLAKEYDMNLKPDQYQAFQRVGLQLEEKLDAPPGAAFLRLGVYDLRSKHAGTLQIPLQSVVASAPR